MNVSLYQAAAAMNASARWQDAIAENLAVSPVPGARKQEVSFSAIESGMAKGVSKVNGGSLMIPTATTSLNFQPGSFRPTNLPTDLALEGPGFIEVQLPNGSHAYTRDGELQFNAQGQLVTKQGYMVLSDSGPIQKDPNSASPISIGPGGEVSQGGEIRGKLRLVEFNQPQLLNGIGDGLFLADNPQLLPTNAQTTRVRQGFLETANTSPTTEMANLITSMRLFEANQKVMQMQDDRMGRVITDLGSPA